VSSSHEALGELDETLFGQDYSEITYKGQWWLAYEGGRPVGFAGAQIWKPDNCLYLRRAGVLPEARGKGLQRRLIRARLAWGREQGARAAYTYTTSWNLASANNLIHEGFTLWKPEWRWAGADMLYWWRKL